MALAELPIQEKKGVVYWGTAAQEMLYAGRTINSAGSSPDPVIATHVYSQGIQT
eukprot:CAMPEP_0170583804 /NCGR_PEP_ID=MMETSP0224-20130122/8341_1 /TAXON_ID=285029 /ORGANISM="Togula jolla, Strain CCCM 725" /LENGTH=53 /DNA_ID=CAMNT_0010907177 /DNA_START=103 /DNA_END=261 /DNA_ORIENTATION=+